MYIKSLPNVHSVVTATTKFFCLESLYCITLNLEELLLNQPVTAYRFVNQAEVTIDRVDDKEEMQLTDVSISVPSKNTII